MRIICLGLICMVTYFCTWSALYSLVIKELTWFFWAIFGSVVLYGCAWKLRWNISCTILDALMVIGVFLGQQFKNRKEIMKFKNVSGILWVGFLYLCFISKTILSLLFPHIVSARQFWKDNLSHAFSKFCWFRRSSLCFGLSNEYCTAFE